MEEKVENVTEEVTKVNLSSTKEKSDDNITKVDLNKPIEPKEKIQNETTATSSRSYVQKRVNAIRVSDEHATQVYGSTSC